LLAGLRASINPTFFRMRSAGFFFFLAAWLLAGMETASAQFLAPRRPKTSINKLMNRQAPPRVNSAIAAEVNPGNARVIVSLSKQRVYLMAGNSVYIDSPISSGKRAGTTPTGRFTIMEKDLNHRSSIYGDFVDGSGRIVRSGVSTKVDSAPSGTRYVGAPMRYFCRLTRNGVGMHIGILPGYPASHGCIRLPAEIAPLIYEKVKVGTTVTIEG
jgi:lipoprotein-anchoring transpeptidase ErfK/SrfK